MNLIALGINHTTASLDVREKVAFASAHVSDALSHASEMPGVDEIAILSTCNRTEIYASGDCTSQDLLRWMADYKYVPLADLQDVHYTFSHTEAAGHMMSVACGLDSQVLGEPQILGQMKTAFSQATEAKTLGGELRDLFHRVFSTAKKVRSQTAIGQNPVSVAFAAVSLAQQIFSDLKTGTALLIGAGETIDLAAKHMVGQSIGRLIVANRTLENAQALAEKYDAQAIVLADIPKYLHEVDIIISSTASQLPVLGKGAVEQALKKRKHKPMFMVDIAVPRDIEPQVNELDDVYLYTVDDLKEVIDDNLKSRQESAELAKEIIGQGVLQFQVERRAQDSVDTIKVLRQQLDEIRQVELVKAQKMLAAGHSPERVLEQFARGLTNKILHPPSAQLKKAAQVGDTSVINAAQVLFDLPKSQSNQSESE